MFMKIEETFNAWKALFPLSRAQAELLRNKFTTEYNYNSNHIEGNTLTYGQAADEDGGEHPIEIVLLFLLI